MNTADDGPTGRAAEDRASGLFLWLAWLPCCDGWGLYHAKLDDHCCEPPCREERAEEDRLH